MNNRKFASPTICKSNGRVAHNPGAIGKSFTVDRDLSALSSATSQQRLNLLARSNVSKDTIKGRECSFV